MKKLKIAIYGREFHQSVLPYVQELFDFFRTESVELAIYHPFHEFLARNDVRHIDWKIFTDLEFLPQATDLMLSLGGDGTMLAAVSLVGDTGIPVAGVNFGRLGFLAGINKDELEPALTALLEGNYDLDKRALLTIRSPDGDLFGDKNFALNDITIFKYDSSAMITIKAFLDGERLNDYWADGLIVATPTGSTAYSLSCGGPIIIPGSNNFVVTPVSPHNLNVRPVVISAESVLDLQIESRTGKYLLSCDSMTKTCDTKIRLQIKKAPFDINLIRLKKNSYFETLRNKLLWGLDARNY